jgi:hypothetical protein
MYHILNFYTIIFLIFCLKINSKMIKFEMMVLLKKEKTDMTDTDMVV